MRAADLDPRLPLLLGLGHGLLVWRSGPLALCLTGGLFLLLTWLAGKPMGNGALAGRRGMLRAGLPFVLGWAGLKTAVLLWEGGGDMTAPALAPALAEGALLGLRLCCLLLIGLFVTTWTSPLRLGQAARWLLRPLLGRRAWEIALALALMLHFMPLVWDTAGRIRLALRCRALPLSRPRQAAVLVGVLLRRLSQAAWTQTLAIAARHLDHDAAWRGRLGRGWRDAPWWMAALLSLALAWLAAR